MPTKFLFRRMTREPFKIIFNVYPLHNIKQIYFQKY